MSDPVPKTQSKSAVLAITLVIVGVLTMIWSGVWWWAMHNGDVTREAWMSYVCTGLLMTGLALTVIGVLVGRIGAAAKASDTASDRPGAPNPGAGMAIPAAMAAGAMPVAQPGVPAGYVPTAGGMMPAATTPAVGPAVR